VSKHSSHNEIKISFPILVTPAQYKESWVDAESVSN